MGGSKVIYCDTLDTPIGSIVIKADNLNLLEIYFNTPCEINPNEITEKTKKLLIKYFEGGEPDFSVLPFKFGDQGFFVKCYKALLETSYGTTLTYAQLAELAGNPKAYRAAANAMRANRYLIAIPCHRVLHKSCGIGSYLAGKEKKAWLLHHESL